MTPEEIKIRYEQRALGVLQKLAAGLREAGLVVDEPVDLSSDDYRWSFTVHLDRDVQEFAEHDVTIDFQIDESEQYDEEENGVNFSLSAVQIGGRIICQATPFNYTRAWGKAIREKSVFGQR